MKKITLFLLAALLVSASGFAQKQVSQRQLNSLPLTSSVAKTQPSKRALQHANDISMLQARRGAFKNYNAPWTNNAPKKAPQKAITGSYEYITDQPDGTYVNYSRGGTAYFYFWGYILNAQIAGAVGNVVVANDNTIYFKNLITQYSCNSWTKGRIEGNKIVIEFPQKCLSFGGYDYYLEYGSIDFDSDNFDITILDNNTLTLDYDPATGTISTPADSPFATGDAMVVMVADDESWVGYADFNFKYTKVTESVVEAPAGLQTEQYALAGEGYDGSLVQVGFAGDDVYVQGICESLPDNWIKGTVSDGKVVFKNGQYIGADESSGYHIYLMSAVGEQAWDDYYEEWYTEYTFADQDITFDYDPATKKLTNGSTFLLNCGKDDVYYTAAVSNGMMVPFVEVAATPAAPQNVAVNEYSLAYFRYGYGWGYLQFDLPTSDVDGNYILPEKMSYVVYGRINGEEKQLTFSHYDHKYLDEDMSEFSYGFSDGWDFGASGTSHSAYYFVVGPEAYGIQSIYRGAGEERRSEITWVNVEGLGSEIQPEAATPAYPDIDPEDKGSEIDYGYYTGDEDVLQTTNNEKPETYDIAIKIDDPALVGSYIESITFPLMTLKYVKNVSVWLSSQLRIENGVNVPDLASKSVLLLGKEEGFISVDLDKPYIIPEEGVYVGYSFTVSNVESDETNKNPIAITDQPNEGGFYIHTSDGILKWLDLSEDFGGSALIQVKLGGSKIKANAATSADGEHLYILSNAPIEIPVKIVNHGSEGVKTVKVAYTVTGDNYTQSETQDIALDSPIDGFFGKQTTTTLNIPAIAQNGNYDIKVSIPEVNGVDNEETANAWIPISVLNTVPKHRAVVEEYTGLWCGWCPRGFVALEKLAKLYPDDYIRISYHNSDAMEILPNSYFPSPVNGFPDAWIDRIQEVDPYYGSSDNNFGIANDLAERSKVFGQAAVELSTEWSDDGNSINVNTAVTFPYSVENGSFALEYVLVSDGLTDASWGQSNYYSGGSDGGDLAKFNNADETVYGLTFDDVAVLVSEIGGIEGSLPANANADEPVLHNYVFNLADAINTNGVNLIQDKSSLRVVVLLVDATTGEIYNANQAEVGQSSEGAVGINGVDESALSVTSVKTYDASGRQVTTLQKGVNIRVINFSDGSKKVFKVMK